MNLSRTLSDFIEKDLDFQNAFRTVKENSSGKIWLIGGYISRNLANTLYGTGQPEEGDYDFIVEQVNKKLTVPKDWEISSNSFGNPKVINQKLGIEIDIVPIGNIHSIQSRGLKPSIENFLSGVPLTIQAFCYDFDEKLLIGEVGINSLQTRAIGINNLEAITHLASMKGTRPEEIVKTVAASFEFKTVL